MRPLIDVKVDYAFKKVFGTETNTDLLSSILHAVLRPPPGREFVGLEIRNPFNPKDTTDDKLSVLDIKARDASGRLFNIEMQMIAPQFYPKRVLYYWAKVYQQQLEEGHEYHELLPTVSISFLDSVLFRQVENLHHHFCVIDPKTQVRLTDDLEIHVVELPKFALRAEELSTPFDIWCYFLRHAATLDTANLPAALDNPIIRRAMEVLNVLSQTELERERYESRMKGLRDERSLEREFEMVRTAAKLEGRDEGRKEGRDEGKKEGRDEGILIGQILLAQKLLKQAPPSPAELKSMSQDDLARLASLLEEQLKSR
jgi:predicted transposase/invertase (TIGR01784 family)